MYLYCVHSWGWMSVAMQVDCCMVFVLVDMVDMWYVGMVVVVVDDDTVVCICLDLVE